MNVNQTTPNVGSLMLARTMDLSVLNGLHGLGPLASLNRVPSRSERARLRHIVDLQSKVLESLNEAIISAETIFNEVSGRWKRTWEEMESIQAELQSARSTVKTLQSQKEALSTKIRGLQGLLHPVRRLPMELLVEIFELVVKMPGCIAFHEAIKLSHVCRTWRNAATSHSTLWTTVTINLNKSVSDVDMLTVVISSRIGRLPVALQLVYRGADQEINTLRTKLELISYRLGVVGSLSLETCQNQRAAHREILSLFQRHAHSVHDLTLIGDSDSPPRGKNIDIVSFFSAAVCDPPCIKSITLRGIGGFNVKFTYDLMTLTNLHLHGTTEAMIPLLYIFVRCPNLEHISIHGFLGDITDVDEEEVELPDEIVRPAVRTVSLEHGAVIEMVAVYIQMPRLKKLDISGTMILELSLLFQDLSELDSLTLPDIDVDDWASIAPSMPNLKMLTTTGCGGLELLANWEEAGLSESPFRKLETIQVSLTKSQIDLEMFNRLVERRCLSGDITGKARDLDTVQCCHFMIICHALWSPPMTKSWRESRLLGLRMTRDALRHIMPQISDLLGLVHNCEGSTSPSKVFTDPFTSMDSPNGTLTPKSLYDSPISIQKLSVVFFQSVNNQNVGFQREL
ncbi:hypothetical protein FRC17_004838 [Serendipita sp. 399]|nr:hypothetical protein FRC17_004838 [Serendipita sp. 399]